MAERAALARRKRAHRLEHHGLGLGPRAPRHERDGLRAGVDDLALRPQPCAQERAVHGEPADWSGVRPAVEAVGEPVAQLPKLRGIGSERGCERVDLRVVGVQERLGPRVAGRHGSRDRLDARESPCARPLGARDRGGALAKAAGVLEDGGRQPARPACSVGLTLHAVLDPAKVVGGAGHRGSLSHRGRGMQNAPTRRLAPSWRGHLCRTTSSACTRAAGHARRRGRRLHPAAGRADPDCSGSPRDHRRARLRGRRHAPAVHDPVDLQAVHLRPGARRTAGCAAVDAKVGRRADAATRSTRSASRPDSGRPLNPMINAGAIPSASLGRRRRRRTSASARDRSSLLALRRARRWRSTRRSTRRSATPATATARSATCCAASAILERAIRTRRSTSTSASARCSSTAATSA